MSFDPVLAAVRFGTGLSPVIAPPDSVEAMMARLRGPDEAARDWPVLSRASLELQRKAATEALRVRQEAAQVGSAERAAAAERLRTLTSAARLERLADMRTQLARLVAAPDGLRERLVLFWADHFTVVAPKVFDAREMALYVEEAIRPHVAGRFGDMLAAVTTHPAMLRYLDQSRSVGPDSEFGLARGRGLNENLARELLELHTVGVEGPYSQADVRELAELLTGLTLQESSMVYRPNFAQPGSETVLGATYAEDGLDAIRSALDDLAVHPATAAHVGRKLAVHFVADEPPEELVSELAEVFLATGGDLGAVTEALLRHPASWDPERRKVRQPLEFLVAALRALGVSGDWVASRDRIETQRLFLRPLEAMGQPWQRPAGPDGWPEAAEAWVTPPGVAGRIDWAMTMPEEILTELPDPRDFVAVALGPQVSEAVDFAARAAERRSDGVGLVLASAEFQRR